jgi:hypothetical protein
MIERELSFGKVCIVDDVDADLLLGINWRLFAATNNLFYARSKWANWKESGKTKTILLHRLILCLEFGDGKIVDHIDGNGLNNRRSNLRVCLHAQNVRNRKKCTNSSTDYKGVYRRGQRFEARITSNGERFYLGNFSTPEQAHSAYSAAAIKLHGEFARTK